MRIHSLQHVDFEGLAHVETWAKSRGHRITKTLLFQEAILPKAGDYDWLVILGGPMSVSDERKFPWLIQEKKFIEEAMAKGKIVLGICLGAQLIANVLGARVYKNHSKEIGWFPVTLTKPARQSEIFSVLPQEFSAFHWHGETFDLPSGSIWTARTDACAHQAFEYERRVFGLQFHLESSEQSIRRLIDRCPEDLADGRYVQKPEEILSRLGEVQVIQGLLHQMLDRIQSLAEKNITEKNE